MSLATEKLKEAIQANDRLGVTVLLALGEQMGNISEFDTEPLLMALTTRDPSLLRQVAAYPWSGYVLAKGYAMALEKDWSEDAQTLYDMGRNRPLEKHRLHLLDALRSSASHGWVHAMDHIMKQAPGMMVNPSHSRGRHDNPLVCAVRSGQPAALACLLQETVADRLFDQAIQEVIAQTALPMLPLLWFRLTSAQRESALHQMAQDHRPTMVDWVLQTHSIKPLQTVWGADPTQCQKSLVASIEMGHTRLTHLLLPLVDPKADKSAALRMAVRQDNSELIAHLLPLSDLQAARRTWLHQTPPQWAMVDRLGLHLSPEQQADWCNRPEMMPQTMAARRAAETLQSPPPAPRRSRLRA